MNTLKIAVLSFIALLTFVATGHANGRIDTRTVETLEASLNQMISPLPQAQQIDLLQAFFTSARFNRCLQTRSPDKCYPVHGGHSERDSAMRYLSERRLDNDVERSVKFFLGGTKFYGHSRRQSFVLFIQDYGRFVDGKTAFELQREYATNKRETGRLVGDHRVTNLSKQHARLAKWQQNLTLVPLLNIEESKKSKTIENCETHLRKAKMYIAAAEELLRNPQAPGPSKEQIGHMNSGRDCEAIAYTMHSIPGLYKRQIANQQPSRTQGIGGLFGVVK